MKFYTGTHEWAELRDGKAYVGISAHAAEELGEVVYVELPEVGAAVSAGWNPSKRSRRSIRRLTAWSRRSTKSLRTRPKKQGRRASGFSPSPPTHCPKGLWTKRNTRLHWSDYGVLSFDFGKREE